MRRIAVWVVVIVVALAAFFFLPVFFPHTYCNPPPPGEACAEAVTPVESISCVITGLGTYIPSSATGLPVATNYRLGCYHNPTKVQ
jgi:hypothetical protein